jgi:hypothetical protein
MSKGYGAVQRALLACLEAQPREYQRWKLHGYVTHAYPAWHSVDSVAGDVFSTDGERTEPTRAQVESVRRAAKRLAAKGLAEIAYVTVTVTRRDRRGVTEADIRKLSIRPVLTETERDAELAESAERAQRLAAIMGSLR